ncbi:deoxyguanosinetriphosphate triphosphohydrolase [Gulosibacter faecalis]|uniref:Deoxyguanosinetriphosphate triphosphohydrolase-like protein n=1 Tax=Gulosibacter faecalis TaxID=272240 RepID=A0ABW5V1N1_9MICO|nr:deoxyguanosinetriphosphate triphosphohydrolase [Gulosibacter faecalis]
MAAAPLDGPASDYSQADADRFRPEFHENRRRSSFARDRARLLHSSGLRRLALKTQVLSPTTGADFARNRLTHSLEVAQVGREIAGSLALDPDIVDTACLAHDIGHPPFGHNGERALNEWSTDIGGFEGNAQTLRLVSRLEPKVFGDEGEPFGLNLTRASLDAACKYPWDRETGLELGTRKFGVYEDDLLVFEWLRAGAPDGRKCIEAQVMDLSDDIAYSVHDLEDAVVEGYLPLEELESPENREAILFNAAEWSGRKFDVAELDAALERLLASPYWVHHYSATARDRGALKNLTSQLIGRFAKAATSATLEAYGASAPLIRFRAEVIVPREIEAEIALLKGAVAGFVMSLPTRQPIYAQQRELLTELLEGLWRSGAEHLEREFSDLFAEAGDDAARRRVIVDQVASLTDQSALALHANVTRRAPANA